MGPTMADSRTARVHKPKNSAIRSAGANRAAMARPADWLLPMHRPAITAATQNSGAEVAATASSVITIQPYRVMASARRWPMRSCQWPKAKAPTAAAMLTRKISTMVSVCSKPSTCSA